MALADPTRHPLLVLSDAAAVGGGIATFLSWVPPAVGLVSLVYLLIQIWESKTIQYLIHRLRAKLGYPVSPDRGSDKT